MPTLDENRKLVRQWMKEAGSHPVIVMVSPSSDGRNRAHPRRKARGLPMAAGPIYDTKRPIVKPKEEQ